MSIRSAALLAVASIGLASIAVVVAAPASPAVPAILGPDRGVLPMPLNHFQGKVGHYPAESDPPRYPDQPGPPPGAPNVLVVLLDDVGFGQTSTFGGGIETPSLDALARDGVRFTQFHTTGLCSPTRAALLTGRNHHTVGSGKITEIASGYDGYTSLIPKEAASIAQVLRYNGYATAMFGKNHNTPEWESSAAGPFDRWPTGLGFDYFYGFNGGQTSQFEPTLYENHRPVGGPFPAGYHLSEDLATRAIDWVRQVKSVDPAKPFFLYFAPGATHAPHHAPPQWIERFRGRFDAGWDEYRRATLERQRRLGLVPRNAELWPRPAGIQAWDSLAPQERRVAARMMEVFAGFTAHIDHEVGRVIDAVRALPDGGNTLIIYVVGDNGASAEGGPLGTLNETILLNGMRDDPARSAAHLDEIGSARYENHFPFGWALAMNTPFPWYKMVSSHLGAIRNGLVVSWPARFKGDGGLRSQFHHVVDIYPTILEAAGLPVPHRVDGIEQLPLAGASLLYALDHPQAPSPRHTQYFEIQGNRSIYHDGWFGAAKLFAVSDFWAGQSLPRSPDQVTWELYDLASDPSEVHDLAALQPDRVKALETLFWEEARRNGALPITGVSTMEEISGAWRPSVARGRKRFTYFANAHVPENSAPPFKNRSFRIDADVVLHPGASGVLVAEGGRPGGFSLFVKDGRLHFAYNFLDLERTDIVSAEPVPVGARTLSAVFRYDGGGAGRGGALQLLADGRQIGAGRIERTVPARFTLNENFDVGADTGSPASEAYASPNTFTGGELAALRVELEGP